MAKTITLRPAGLGDYAWALQLYLVTMGPLTAELMPWDEARQSEGFARQWKADDVRIILADADPVGWLQAREAGGEIFLQQFFISPEHQGQGIGSQIMQCLLDEWRTARKPVVLTVLKNNPARRLYERFGFAVVAEAGVKLRMQREP